MYIYIKYIQLYYINRYTRIGDDGRADHQNHVFPRCRNYYYCQYFQSTYLIVGFPSRTKQKSNVCMLFVL